MGDPGNVASEDEKGMKTEKCGIYDKEGGMGFVHQGVLGFDSRGSRPATLGVKGQVKNRLPEFTHSASTCEEGWPGKVLSFNNCRRFTAPATTTAVTTQGLPAVSVAKIPGPSYTPGGRNSL